VRHFALDRRKGGWWLALPKGLLLLAAWTPLFVSVFGAFHLLKLARSIPEVPVLSAQLAPHESRVESLHGLRLGGNRRVGQVAYDELDPTVIGAFLAAEDENFFSHDAFSLRGILRAAFANLRAGRTTQGASTITQQVARRFLSNEKTYARKVEELLLARRIESNHSKHAILEAYLAGVYFGAQATGLNQASWTYFGHGPDELALHEAALLAGLLPAPSVYDPFENPELARRERARVLRRMEATGFITAEVRSKAEAAPLGVVPDPLQPEDRMPHAVEAAIRALADLEGLALEEGEVPKSWSEGGYRVVLTSSPAHRQRMEESLREAIIEHDQRQGWRGPVARASDPEALQRLRDKLGEQPEGAWRLAVVTEVTRDRIVADADLGGPVTLALADNRWAEPAQTPRHYKRPVELRSFERIAARGDVVLLRNDGTWRLAQFHDFEGAFATLNSQTGEVLASVGAFDPGASQFDRAQLGCRQPGSVFKPFVYAEAFGSSVTPATMLSDGPVEVSTGRGGVWRPRNADRDFKGYVTAANALAWSRNIPTIHVMEHVGIARVVQRARKLGIESPIDTTSSASLGASCARPIEIAGAYLAFQRRGRTAKPFEVATIFDTRGDVVRDHAHFATHAPSTLARVARMGRTIVFPPIGMSENVAFIMLDLLRKVVTSGTAHELPDDWLVAGKTGTTNKYDAWFVGLDGRWTSIVWVGSDTNERELGRGEHGATVAMPAFASFWEAFVERIEGEVDWPGEPPPGVEYLPIDPGTGLRAPPGEWGVMYPFVKGTAPTEVAPNQGTKQAQRAEELLYDF
jgi:penicillin-binding protein 1A